MLDRKDHEIIIFLIIVGYLSRILLSPFFVMFPYIPHDYYAHSGAGESMVEGNLLMETSKTFSTGKIDVSGYGPFFVTLMTVWYSIFGVFDFLMFKILAIVFDVLTILMVYFVGKKIFHRKTAFYLSLLYCFSFIILYNSALIGDDSIYSLFFFLVSTYFLIDKKPSFSAAFFSISIMFRFSPCILYFPALCYYVFKKWKLNGCLKYILVAGFSFLIMLSPFILLAGWDKSVHYIFGSHLGFQQVVKGYANLLTFYNIIKLATNIDTTSLMLPILFTAYIITLCFIFVKKLKNSEIELFRNSALFGIVGLLFGPGLVGFYINWALIPLFMLFGTKLQGCNITKQWVVGVVLICLSLLVYSMVYREGIVEYSKLDFALLLSVVVLAPIGAFNMFHYLRKDYRLIWTFIILATALSAELSTSPLVIFPIEGISKILINLDRFKVVNELYSTRIQGRPEVFLSYGIFFSVSAVILWVCLGFLYYIILNDKFKNYEDEK